MLTLPNLELLEYKVEQKFFADEKNKNAYEKIIQNRRCVVRDFRVEGMFPQMWGSTCLGFDIDKNGHANVGGQAMTEAYTVVFFEPLTETHIVCFGGTPCYQVRDAGEEFYRDFANHNLKPLSKALLAY